MFQSERTGLYEEALARLRGAGLAYDCGCTRAEVARAAGAPDVSDPVDGAGAVYAGTCRGGLAPGRTARAVRFRVPDGTVAFEDRVRGRVEEDVLRAVGDFVVRRADGPFAYQLAVVVDDAEQGVTEVVRGGDLLSSTARQVVLQRALGLPTPAYAHLPLVLGPDGKKLGKRDGALPLELLDERRVRETLALALRLLGQGPVEGTAPEMLGAAARGFDEGRIPAGARGPDGRSQDAAGVGELLLEGCDVVAFDERAPRGELALEKVEERGRRRVAGLDRERQVGRRWWRIGAASSQRRRKLVEARPSRLFTLTPSRARTEPARSERSWERPSVCAIHGSCAPIGIVASFRPWPAKRRAAARVAAGTPASQTMRFCPSRERTPGPNIGWTEATERPSRAAFA